MGDNGNFGTTTYDPYDGLLSIAGKSEGGNATFAYSDLTNLEQTAVAALIGETQEGNFNGGDIKFGEGILRVIQSAKKGIENAFITVIAPTNEFGETLL
nr:hypothetical protein [Candidatus Gracilibacteria bacterium]